MTVLRPMELLDGDPAQLGLRAEVRVEPTTGSPSVQVPLPLTAGRDEFGPALALTYGGGHDPLSPLPHGWALAGLPSIDRDLRDGLPRYDGSERYLFAGQPLVPVDDVGRPTAWNRDGHAVRAFRPRVESQPIRAERWTDQTTGRIHWRVRTGDGAVQVFGRRSDDESRIADPADPRRTFRWLLEAAFDRLGNAMVVRYLPEDAVGVAAGSLDATRFVGALGNRYVKRIHYGNDAPLGEDDSTDTATWFFEAVFDYGDHDVTTPGPSTSAPWPVRQDIGFTARPGFEVRTRRLLRRVLMFHRFPSELGEAATLVGSLEMDLAEAPEATTLVGVRHVGWRGPTGSRVSRETPWTTFEYTSAGTDEDFAALEAPLLNRGASQLLDLYGEGLPGLLTLDDTGAWYASNLGDGKFGPHQAVPSWPRDLPEGTLADFDGDGNLELVQFTGPRAGYYRLNRRSRAWEHGQQFTAALNVSAAGGAAVRTADLSGDGRPDVVLFHRAGITWYPSRGAHGFGAPMDVRLPPERFPAPNPPLDRFMADMTGDGLADIVEVLNGSVRYWPNLGRGRFGDPVWMDSAPRLADQGAYDAARVLLLDLDGTGASDLLYLRGDGAVVRYPNHRGVAFGAEEVLAWGPRITSGSSVQTADLFGDGSTCLVWTAPTAAGAAGFHALRLTSTPGARQIAKVTQPLGEEVALEWGHSVRHYLRDVESGRGWETPLPSQRPVVDVVRRTEPVDDQEQSEEFRYHDGHYDPRERSFALFAITDHIDVSGPVTNVIPLLTRRFSHTGEFDYGSRFSQHHYAGDLQARPPPESAIELGATALLTKDFDDAYRALLGSPAREETYGLDPLTGEPNEHPFVVTAMSRRARIVRLADDDYRTASQVYDDTRHGSIYEQDPSDPRETVSRTLEVDAYQTPLQTLEAGLPNRSPTPRFDDQRILYATLAKTTVVHIDSNERFELGIPTEARGYEVHFPAADDVFAGTLVTDLVGPVSTAQAYTTDLNRTSSVILARELTHEKRFYWNDTQTAVLSLGQAGLPVLPHHAEEAAYDGATLDAELSVSGVPFVSSTELPGTPGLGYVDGGGGLYYRLGPTTKFEPAASFFRLTESVAYDSGTQAVLADPYDLATVKVTDQVGNETTASIDYHLLAPRSLTDPNGTIHEVDYDPLGIVTRRSRRGEALPAASSTPVPYGFGALTPGAPLPTFAAALADPESALGTAEGLLLYEFPTGAGVPMRTLQLVAEEFSDRGPDGYTTMARPARAQVTMAYADGFGRSIQQRTLVESGPAMVVNPTTDELEDTPGVSPRWRVTGYVVFDEKQQPREEYEPLFRDGSDFDAKANHRQHGVTSTVSYDALGRPIREDRPNKTFTEAHYLSWSRIHYDENDSSDRATDYISARSGLPSGDPEKLALDQALLNSGTPTSVHLDALGQEIGTVEVVELGVELEEQYRLDVRGLSMASIDRRGLTASTRKFDRLGRLIIEHSMDAGRKKFLFDGEGREVRYWHGTASAMPAAGELMQEVRTYDLAGRLTQRQVIDVAGSLSFLAEKMTYGEGLPAAADRNQLGRLAVLEDVAGRESTTRYGAFGEVLEVARELTATPGLDPDWSGTPTLEGIQHVTKSVFDALGRRTRLYPADGTERHEDYHRSGGVSEARLIPSGSSTPTVMLTGTVFNARGQRTQAYLGNDVEVAETYDPETFRLHQRKASRTTPTSKTFQDLRHHYDPVGNLVYLNDLAQSPTATDVINGLLVGGHRTYKYDARYQLTEATGRVHEALMRPDYAGLGRAPAGAFRGTRQLGFLDGGSVGRYRRTFTYDAGGNGLGWVHGQEPGTPVTVQAWTFDKWVSASSNRCFPRYDPSGIPYPDPESKFDVRGNIVSLDYIQAMEWSIRGQLRRSVIIPRAGIDDDERYDYAADGTRLRKVTQRDLGGGVAETETTVFLDGCEHRQVARAAVVLHRWTSHVEVEDERVASIYVWTLDSIPLEVTHPPVPSVGTPVTKVHYHLGTRVGSVSLELDDVGDRLSYEEYFPFGRTAMLAGNATGLLKARSLRFVGKNQDDATAFYVFQFRFYAPFIGNWVSPDPAGEVDGLNTYQYARNNPARFVDPEGTDSEDLQFFGPELETYKQAVEYLEENSVFYTEDPVLREREGGGSYWFVGRFVQDASRGPGGRVSELERAEIQVEVSRETAGAMSAQLAQAELERDRLREAAGLPTDADQILTGSSLDRAMDALGGAARPIDALEYARRQAPSASEASADAAAEAVAEQPAPAAAQAQVQEAAVERQPAVTTARGSEPAESPGTDARGNSGGRAWWKAALAVGAAVAVGAVATAFTGGLAAPLAGGVIGSVAAGALAGAAGGAAGGVAYEAVQQAFEGEFDAAGLGEAALTGGVVGGGLGAGLSALSAAVGAVGAATGISGVVGSLGARLGQTAFGRAATGALGTVARAPGIRHAGQVLRAAEQAGHRFREGVASAGRRVSQALRPRPLRGPTDYENYGGEFLDDTPYSVSASRGARELLARSEATGGHLIARHVGQTSEQLAARLAGNARLAAASTFNSLAQAEGAVGSALQVNASQVSNWVAAGARGRLVVNAPFSGGSVLVRGASSPVAGTGVRVVLQGNGGGAYHVLTGFPVL